MRVSQLIEELKRMPQEMEIEFDEFDNSPRIAVNAGKVEMFYHPPEAVRLTSEKRKVDLTPKHDHVNYNEGWNIP